jgi:serine/threonine protein kinase/tetratricopeptide (TPR) repeat protein
MDEGEQTETGERPIAETAPPTDETSKPWGPYAELDQLVGSKLRGVSHPRLIGQRYRIERLLGRGGMGEVYLAHDQRLARQVALKLVRTSSTTKTERLQARLEREALALARVEHPNVVGIHDVGSHDGQTYFTMQYVPGITLRRWQDDAHTRAELLDVYLQAARGLAAAHSVGVVHRDFKPDNVIVGHDRVVRVLDFGLAGALRPEDSSVGPTGPHSILAASAALIQSDSGSAETVFAEAEHLKTDSDWGRMTQTGALLGTLAYMASEQLAGREADTRSDQFGFCVAMWEALTRKRPFVDTHAVGLLASIQRGYGGPLPRPRWLGAMLLQGLAYEPQQRWPSMAALIDAIERRRTRGRKLMIGLGSSVVIIGASLLGRAVAPSTDPSTEQPAIETCDAFVRGIDEVWSASDRESIAAHGELKIRSSDYAIAAVDGLARDWKQAATALCDGDTAPAANDPTRACLARWLAGFGSTIELLTERSDAQTLASAPDLLAALVPANSDYCAAQPVNPEIWQMTVRARALAVLGDLDAAGALAEAAITKANDLDALEFSAERALAHSVRAEVAMRDRQLEHAITEFKLARQHALATESSHLLLTIWTAWAKLLTVFDDPGKAEQARDLIESAETLLSTLHVGPHDVRRAELLEAHGLVERVLGNHDDAIARHREAQAMFIGAGQPTLASKSIFHIGRIHQNLGESEQARRKYAEAIAVLEAGHLPPSYRTRVKIEHNLGLLAYEANEPSQIAEGLQHYEFVLEHGSEQERFDVLELILVLVLRLGEPELVQHWTKRALAGLEARPSATTHERFGIQRAVGFALVLAGDLHGEAMLADAERLAESLPLEMQVHLQASWIEWLEQVGRCSEASDRRQRLAARVAVAERELVEEHETWRAAGSPCTKDTRESQP